MWLKVFSWTRVSRNLNSILA